MWSGAAVRQAYRDRTVVVLGAGGFIGRHVSLLLQGLGAKVYGSHRPGHELPLFEGMFKPLQCIEWTAIDLTNRLALSEWLIGLRPDIIFNLAGYGIWRQQQEANLFYAINAQLVETLVEGLPQFVSGGWPGLHLVHVGSAQEYGQVSGDLEEMGPSNPTTVYGKSKLQGTQSIVEAYQRGARLTCARLFTIYGPGAQSDKLLPYLMATRGKDSPIALSGGLQQRDFTYVEEVAGGLLRLGVLKHCQPIVNLATGRLNPVRNFVQIASRHLQIPPDRLHFGALSCRDDEMAHQPVNIQNLQTLLGWQPTLDLEEGIRYALSREGIYV